MLWEDTDNPFEVEAPWLKGALHTHTTRSDGVVPPDEIAQVYRDIGFDFLVLSDHNKVTRLDASPDGLVVLPGIELGLASTSPDKYWHLVGLGAGDDAAVPPLFGDPAGLYAYLRPRVPFCILAHPYWSQLSGRDLTQFEHIDAVEVWNSGCEVAIGRGYSEYQWDWCLGAGRRVMGVAVDDAHGRREIGMGWVMVRAREQSVSRILDALRRGLFYSSCGPEIRDLRRTESGIEVTTSPCRSISFIADRQSGAHVVSPDGGEVTSAAYVLKGGETYVRVQCVDSHGRRAWSNPFYPLRVSGNHAALNAVVPCHSGGGPA